MKPITKDCSVYKNTPAWIVRLLGDQTCYKDPQTGKSKSNAVVVIRSLHWPGAYTFYNESRGLISIYCGDGHKYEPVQTYYPTVSPLMQTDPEEYISIPEPNPSD